MKINSTFNNSTFNNSTSNSIRNTPSKAALVRSFLLTASMAGVIHSGSVSAAGACKGLENEACNSNASCSWVEGYERKDGRKVKSFCRSKSRSSNQAGKTQAKADKNAG